MRKTTHIFFGATALLLTASLPLTTLASEQNPRQALPVAQSSERASLELPRRGQTKEAVAEKLGRPEGIKGPVGEPPITAWFYEGFVVYFEHDRVIHSVVKPKRSS
ncbi:hypothetical protein [Marinobacter sp.]|uniref:hypothetical protein n=1 Tax=Marinobacter sp. TaxID=50741 RepID=UPI00384F66CF